MEETNMYMEDVIGSLVNTLEERLSVPVYRIFAPDTTAPYLIITGVESNYRYADNEIESSRLDIKLRLVTDHGFIEKKQVIKTLLRDLSLRYQREADSQLNNLYGCEFDVYKTLYYL